MATEMVAQLGPQPDLAREWLDPSELLVGQIFEAGHGAVGRSGEKVPPTRRTAFRKNLYRPVRPFPFETFIDYTVSQPDPHLWPFQY
jgi:hypothetical protein